MRGAGIAVALVCCVVAALAGFAVGSRRGDATTTTMLLREAEGNLTQRVLVLSYMRIGETERAIGLLEDQVDTLVTTLAPHASVNPAALVTAKAYRSVVPSVSQHAAALDRVFAAQPAPAPEQCSPPLRRLLEASRAGSAPK